MIVLYDYALFALEMAGILYFLTGLPVRFEESSKASARLFQIAVLVVTPFLLALRSGLDGALANQYGALRLTELFATLLLFVVARYRISLREALYYTFILFLVEIAVEKAAAAFVLSQEGMNLGNHAAILEFPSAAAIYLITPTTLTLGVFFVLKQFFVRVQPKQIGWRELVPMALSMVPVLVVGYFEQAMRLEGGGEALGLALYEFCSMTSVLVMVGVDNVASMREAEQERRMLEALMRHQADQYEQRRRAMEEIRRKHHDLRHHLQYMVQLDSEDERLAYASEALDMTFDSDQFLQTGNAVLDTVLSASVQRCRDNGIRLVLFVEADAMSFMRPADIVALAGNALDNAIEATSVLPVGRPREVLVRINDDAHWLYLHFENGFQGALRWHEGRPVTCKEDARGHGLGLRSIEAAVERYGGTVQMDAEDGVFSLNVLVPREEFSNIK